MTEDAGATGPWVEPDMDDENENPSTPTTTTVTAQFTGTSNGNMTGENDAATLGLDAAVFTVIGSKGGTSNNVGFNATGKDFRLYANKADGNGCELTISVADGHTIKSIKITFTGTANAANCQISVGGTAVKTTDGSSVEVEVDINASAFVLKNVTTGTASTQVRIASIEIVYA